MAFRPNYSQHRAERNRNKQAKRDEKREQRKERAARRKAAPPGNGAGPAEDLEQETENLPHIPATAPTPR